MCVLHTGSMQETQKQVAQETQSVRVAPPTLYRSLTSSESRLMVASLLLASCRQARPSWEESRESMGAGSAPACRA